MTSVNAGYAWRNGFPARADATAFAEQRYRRYSRDDNTIDIVDVLEANRPEGHRCTMKSNGTTRRQRSVPTLSRAAGDGPLRDPGRSGAQEPLQPVRQCYRHGSAMAIWARRTPIRLW